MIEVTHYDADTVEVIDAEDTLMVVVRTAPHTVEVGGTSSTA